MANLLLEVPRYYCPVENFVFRFFSFIEIRLIQNSVLRPPSRGNTVKYLSQGHNRIVRVGILNRHLVNHNHGALNTRHTASNIKYLNLIQFFYYSLCQSLQSLQQLKSKIITAKLFPLY